MSRRAKTLTDEDRVLWNLVARSTRPLKGKHVPEPKLEQPSFEAFLAAATESASPAVPVAVQKPIEKPKPNAHPFDAQTRDKLSKGRLPIEGTVDLHGMTQSEAHSLLLSFLHRAHANGVRYVLVITGKGASFGSEGVLKRVVPAWLSTPSFRPLVSSYDAAARHHGGAGAIYIRLRRRAEAPRP